MLRCLRPIAIEHAARRNRPGSLGPGLELAGADRRGDDVGEIVGLGGEEELVFGKRGVDRPARQSVFVHDSRTDDGAVGVDGLKAPPHPIMAGAVGIGRTAHAHRDIRHRRAQAGQHLLVGLVVPVLGQLLEADPGERLSDIGAVVRGFIEVGEFERLTGRPGPQILVLVKARVRPYPRDHLGTERLDLGKTGHRLADQNAFPVGAPAGADVGEVIHQQANRLAGAARAGQQHFALRRGKERFLRTGLGDQRDFTVRIRCIGLDERSVFVVSQLEMMGAHSHFRVLDFFSFFIFQGRVRFRGLRITKDPMALRTTPCALGMYPRSSSHLTSHRPDGADTVRGPRATAFHRRPRTAHELFTNSTALRPRS